jgi:hypothetical protein
VLSLALVPEDGQEFYVTLECDDPVFPWVERNVVPYLDKVPVGLVSPRMTRREAADALAAYLSTDPGPELIADWPEDVTQFCSLLMIGPGLMVPVPPLTFRLLPLKGFSPAANSAVPHNALHDARSLRDHFLSLLD